MPASTAWWFCGRCGFQNHPRLNQDPARCEQCGLSQTDPLAQIDERVKKQVADSVDYVPAGVHA